MRAGYTFTDPNMAGEVDEYFYHGDHISSVVLVTDRRANIVQHFAYMPFGELLVDNYTVDLDYRFSAKETDRESGLSYFGARYYDNTSAMWLGVDPLWEKNIGASPYNYCHGNPINMIDPDGRDEWEVDQNGYFNKITDNQERDIIYSINTDGNRTGEISFPYGTIEKIQEESKKFTEGDFNLSCISVNNPRSARDLFEFLANPSSFDAEVNTGVEWSSIMMDGENLLTSSHEKNSDRASYGILKNRRGECVIYEHNHNHPNNNPNPSGTVSNDGDIPFIRRLKKWGMAFDYTLFSIYTPSNNKYNGYNETSSNMLDEITIEVPRSKK